MTTPTTTPQEKLPNGRRLLPDKVLSKEREYITKRRKEIGEEPPTQSLDIPEDHDSLWTKNEAPVGLSMSGGGIRSATFNLGVLQALASHGILKSCDYLSTVSGGGYIGGCLTSLLSGNGLRFGPFSKPSIDNQENPHSTQPENFPLRDPEQIHHLRKHGDYLISRDGMFRREALRAVGLVVTGWICMWLVFFTLVMFLSSLFVYFTGWANGHDLWDDVMKHCFCDVYSRVWQLPATVSPVVYFGFGVIINAVVALLTYHILWRNLEKVRKKEGKPRNAGETNNERHERRALIFYALAVLVISNLSLAFFHGENLLAGAIFMFLGVFVSSWLGYIYAPNTDGARYFVRQFRSFMGGSLCIGFYATLSSLLVILLILATTWMVSRTITDWQAMLTAATGFIFARLMAKPASQNKKRGILTKTLFRLAFSLVVPFSLLLSLVGCIGLVLRLEKAIPALTTWDFPASDTLGLAFFTGFILMLLFKFLNFNRISPHYFYRDRLAETYLQTNRSTGFGLTPIRNDENIPLCKLHDKKNGAPYHLIQCAVNMPGSRDLARKDRNSDHFTFSKYYCGSTSTGYVATQDYREGKTKLIRAVAISAAAASSLMGKISTSTFAFILTLFNIRLGYWMPNPLRHKDVELSPLALGRYASETTNLASLRQKQHKGKMGSSDPWGWSWFSLFFKELFNTAKADGKYINLSDGNHAGDNLAIYPLIQRRCRLIICCDAEADPDYNCSSLVSVINQVFVDENITIDIDIKEIRPKEGHPLPDRHYLIGKIKYPDAGYDGTLIYIKSSFNNKDEGPAVKGYAATHEEFPQQTTGDQFFDDDQFEAYRALGHHIAESVSWPSPETAYQIRTGDSLTT